MPRSCGGRAHGTGRVGRAPGARRRHRLHRPAPARRLAAALPRPASATSGSRATSPTAMAPDTQGNPVALRLDLYAPVGDTRTPPGARVGPRRRLQRRRQDQHGARRRGSDVRQAGLRGRLDQLPPARLRLRGQPGHAQCTIAAIEAQHDAQAAVRWLRAQRRLPRHRPDPDRDRRRVRRCDHGDLVGSELRATRAAAATPASRRRCAVSRRSPAALPSGNFANAGDAPGLFFHGTADPSCRRAGPT